MKIDNDLIQQIKITPLYDTIRLEKISDEEYFSKRYSNYISNSRLGLLKSKGAQAFFDGLGEGDYNASFAFGSALHELYLQPELFELIDSVFKPTAKAGVMADYLYNNDGTFPSDDDIKIATYKCNYYKDKLTSKRLQEFKDKAFPYWRDRFLFEQNNPKSEKTRIYTDEKSVGTLKCCLNSINNNENFKNLIHPTFVIEEPYSANEQAILLDIQIEIPGHEARIYKLKAKLDNFTIDKEENTITVNDLKTTSRAAVEFDPTYFSYERELSFYSFLLKICAEKFFDLKSPKIKGNFLVVSTIPEYNSLIYPMTDKLFKNGWKEVVYLLKVVAYLNIIKGYEFKS